MGRALRLAVMGVPVGGGGAQTYAGYVESLALPLWLRLNEAVGAVTAINYGTSGATLNATVSGATAGVAGPMDTAYSFDGADDYLVVANNAVLANMTTQRWAFYVNADTLGEDASRGMFINWGAVSVARNYIRFNSTNRLDVQIITNSTKAAAITNNNQADALLGAWGWLFVDYDDADSLGNGRKIRLFIGNGSGVSQLTLATDTAGTGTITNMVTDLIIGNEADTIRSFDGLMDEVLAGPGLWTADEMQSIVDLSGG